ncbi:MAG TPA: hypothetical protein PLJ25_07525 [Methanothrix sp.]|nr:hypothetical protein [Methanothrix sp.]
MILKMGSLASIVLLLMITIGSAGEIVIGDGTSVSGQDGSSAEGVLVETGSSSQGYVSSIGVIDDLNIDPWVKNTNGDYAEIGVTGTNIAGFSYSYNVYPGEGSSWDCNGVWAYQSLSANSADSLNAYSSAKNAAGDEAHTTLDLNRGSIGSYYSSAYAGSDSWSGYVKGAYAQQIAHYITGQNILVKSWTNNANYLGDQAGARTAVNNGVLNRYSALANAVRYWYGWQYGYGPDAVGVRVDELSASAPDGSIDQHMWAKNYLGNIAEVSTSINDGYLYNSYWNSYSEGYYGLTGAYQSVDASANSISSSSKVVNQRLGTYNNDQQFSVRDASFWNGVSSSFDYVNLNFGLSR